jgi:WD40 repeat protein
MTSTYSSVPVNTAAFTSSGKQLITGHPDGTLRLWDVSALAQLRKFKIGDTVSFAAPISNSKALTIATSRKTARFQVVDLVTGKVLRQSHRLEPSYLEKMVLSPNKKVSAVTDNVGDVLICDLDTMALRTVDNGMSGYDSVAFSENSESFFVGGENQNLSLYNLASLQKEWSLLSEFVPSAAERRLVEERSIRVAEVVERAKERDQQAKSFVRANRNKVYVTFDHYGDMSDPGQKRMVESDALNESKQTKSEDAANAVWLRLHNDSVLPIEFPTESMYLPNPKCFHQFPNGEKIHGLCRDREVGVWFGVRDNRGKGIPYGFDFGSSAVLLPHSSVVFPVPIAIWNKSYSVVFQYSFQNTKASENDREMDYGPKIELRVSKATARR